MDMEENKEKSASQENPVAAGGNGAVRYEAQLMHEAYENISNGKLDAAKEIFLDLIRKFESILADDQKGMIYTELGLIFFWLGDYEAAQNYCEKALACGKNSDQAYNILGKIAVARFEFSLARSYFHKISDNNSAKWFGLCLVSIKLRETIGVEMFLRKALDCGKLPSTDPEYRLYNAYLQLLKGDAKFAVIQARDLMQVKRCECDPSLMLLIAEIFMTAGNYGEASSAAEKVKRTCPKNDCVYAILAHSLYAQENYTGAQTNAEEAVRLNPKNCYAKTVLMKLAVRNGRYSFAEQLGLEILKDCPEYSLGHANLGDVYFIQGLYQMARDEYEQTQQLMNADTKGAKLRQARMNFIDENYSSSADILEKLIESQHTYYDDAMCDLLLCYQQLEYEEKKKELLDKMAFRKSFYHRTEQLLKSFNC